MKVSSLRSNVKYISSTSICSSLRSKKFFLDFQHLTKIFSSFSSCLVSSYSLQLTQYQSSFSLNLNFLLTHLVHNLKHSRWLDFPLPCLTHLLMNAIKTSNIIVPVEIYIVESPTTLIVTCKMLSILCEIQIALSVDLKSNYV